MKHRFCQFCLVLLLLMTAFTDILSQPFVISEEFQRLEMPAPDVLPPIFKRKVYTPLPVIPEGLIKLKKAYPIFVDCVDHESLYLKDGTCYPYDDGEQKVMDTILVRPDIEEMMRFVYRRDETPAVPTPMDEAGRIRFEPFIKKMYGGTEAEVRANLTTIIWLPGILNQELKVSRVNGAADSLQIISNELSQLPDTYLKYLETPGGTFLWRPIINSTRLSMHSFGIAIDINVKYSDYWVWSKQPDGSHTYRNRIPLEIVRIFERHGYIWGGRWLHHDTMHFEFRPELLIK